MLGSIAASLRPVFDIPDRWISLSSTGALLSVMLLFLQQMFVEYMCVSRDSFAVERESGIGGGCLGLAGACMGASVA